MQRQHFYKPPGLIALGIRDLRATASRIYGGMKKLRDKLIKNQEKNTVYWFKFIMLTLVTKPTLGKQTPGRDWDHKRSILYTAWITCRIRACLHLGLNLALDTLVTPLSSYLNLLCHSHCNLMLTCVINSKIIKPSRHSTDVFLTDCEKCSCWIFINPWPDTCTYLSLGIPLCLSAKYKTGARRWLA